MKPELSQSPKTVSKPLVERFLQKNQFKEDGLPLTGSFLSTIMELNRKPFSPKSEGTVLMAAKPIEKPVIINMGRLKLINVSPKKDSVQK